MKMFGLIRLGRDGEVRYTQSGEVVVNVVGAFNYGRKGDDGRRPTQWVDLSFWGDRAEKFSKFLIKGREFLVTIADPHVETYQRGDGGTGAKLVGRIADIEFTYGSGDNSGSGGSGSPAGAQAQPAQDNTPKSGLGSAGSSTGGFDPNNDFDDDIPF